MSPDAPQRPLHSPYDLSPAVGARTPFVFASPHSGSERPDDLGARSDIDEASLRSAEDGLVDRLVASGATCGTPVIAGRISRAYVDLNRDPTELDPLLIEDCPQGSVSPKTAAGFGVIARRGGDGAALYDRRLTMAEATARLDRVHRPYHAALGELMEETHRLHGLAILIDWHSMPSRAAGGLGRSAPGPDVVLGDRHGSSCEAALTRRLRGLFEGAGWRVGLNTPYAGGYSTERWGRPTEGFHAIQIELNRGLYLDEKTLEPSIGFSRCRSALDRVIARLCGGA